MLHSKKIILRNTSVKDENNKHPDVHDLLANQEQLSEWVRKTNLEIRRFQLDNALKRKFGEGELNIDYNLIRADSLFCGFPSFACPFIFGDTSETIIIYHYSLLGEGSFGEVFLGYNLDRSEYCAVKQHFLCSPHELYSTKQELKSLKRIGRLVGVAVGQEDEFFTVQPLARGHNLKDFLISGVEIKLPGEKLKRKSTALPLSYYLEMATKYFEALDELHQQYHIVHRDIKLENVVWDPVERKITILDFGLSAQMTMSPSQQWCYKDLNKVGSLMYAAPDIVHGEEDFTCYSAKTDLYASGLLFGFMALNNAMVKAIQALKRGVLDVVEPIKKNFKEKVKNTPDMYGIRDDLAKLTLDLLDYRASRRPEIAQVLQRIEGFKKVIAQVEQNNAVKSLFFSDLPILSPFPIKPLAIVNLNITAERITNTKKTINKNRSKL